MPGNNFRIQLKSVGGEYLGYLPGWNLGAPTGASGSPDDNNFVQCQTYYYGDGGYLEWVNNYEPGCIKSFSGQFLTAPEDLLSYLADHMALNESSALDMFEMQLQDDYGHPITSPSLVMRMWRDISQSDTQYIGWNVSKKEISGSTITYTNVTGYNNRRYLPGSGRQISEDYAIFGGMFTFNNKICYGFGFGVRDTWPGVTTSQQCQGDYIVATDAAFQSVMQRDPVKIEADQDLGPESDPGGYGPSRGGGGTGGSGGSGPTFDDTSDPFVPSPLPPGISELGFINIYKCSIGSLTLLGETLFPDVGASTDVWGAIVALSDAIWNSKLIDYVVSVHMIPCDVPAGSPEAIKIGTRTLTGITAGKVTSDYVEVNLGTLKIDENFTNFADYACSRARLFLPFYGFVELKPEVWQSAELNVKYRFNIVDGSFIASVYSTVTRHQSRMYSLVGQYSGCACIQCPVSGTSYASMFGGMVSNAGGAAANFAKGNVAGAATSAINAAASSAGSIQMSNPYNSSAAIMGHRYPYLLIERPVPHFPRRYGAEKGFPLLTSKTVGSCKGFTTAEDIILDGVPATKDELARIKSLFRAGVIIK